MWSRVTAALWRRPYLSSDSSPIHVHHCANRWIAEGHIVHFDDFEEQVRNPRTQLTSPSYHCAVLLVEA